MKFSVYDVSCSRALRISGFAPGCQSSTPGEFHVSVSIRYAAMDSFISKAQFEPDNNHVGPLLIWRLCRSCTEMSAKTLQIVPLKG